MSLRELVIKWDNNWRYDYWWRQKYNIPFNSEAHRAANQLDIAFEYQESQMANEAIESLKKEEVREKLRKNGQWMEIRVDKSKEDKLFDKIDLSSF